MKEIAAMARKFSLNASQLKILAMVCMLIDHIGAFLLPQDAALYIPFRTVGRLAFPIFCFLIAEGAAHTRSMPKYMARLGVFALISTPPFNLVHGYRWYAVDELNVFFTLLLGLVGIACIRELAPRVWRLLGKEAFAASPVACALTAAPAIIVLYFAAYELHTDYGGYGVAVIVLFWLLREKPAAAWGAFALLTFVGHDLWLFFYSPEGAAYYVALTPFELLKNRVWEGRAELRFYNARQMAAALAMLPCMLYNGEKGLSSSSGRLAKPVKYAFYAFYPLHLTVIWLIQLALR